MKSLKELFDLEMRSSMTFLCVGISVAVSLLVGFFQYQQLRFDFRFTEHFVAESTKNALVLEQPIMLQRSISEFWQAFEERKSAITGLEVYFDDALVSQNGARTGKRSLLQLESKRCFPSSRQNVCLLYSINPFRFLSQIFFVLWAVILSAIAVYFLRRRIAERNVGALSRPLEIEIAKIAAISEGLKTALVRGGGVETLTGNLPILEVTKLSAAYKDLLEHNQTFLSLEKSAAISESLAEMAAQVAHDIRSPLSALNVAMKSVDALPEAHGLLIRNATRRINEIADGLLEGRKAPRKAAGDPASAVEPVQLTALLDAIIGEKVVQFSENPHIEIRGDLGSGGGLYARIDSSELARIVSNLINNSVEAFVGPGRVTVTIRGEDAGAAIVVSDNGKGIPPAVLARLGEKGVTHGKEATSSGSGIGVHHAREAVERAGGRLKIESRVGIGTTITITLPRAAAPTAERKREKHDAVLIDDDPLVAMTWRMTARKENKSLICFSDPREFFAQASSFALATPLYIDVDLSDGARGEDAAREASLLGFTEIYLATGHDASAISKPSCVTAVVGKDPIF